MLVVALAALGIWPAIVRGPVHPGERVRFVVRGEKSDDGGPYVVLAVEDLRHAKHAEAFIAGRLVRLNGTAPRLPTGEPVVGVPDGTEGVAVEVVASSVFNDEPECRVKVTDGPLAGRLVWVRASRLDAIRPPEPPPPETIEQRRARELKQTLKLRRRRR